MSSFEIVARQDYEEWCRVYRAIIKAEGYLPQCRHLALADFMQNFPRLRVLKCIDLGCLACRQKAQHAARDFGVEPCGEKGRDQGVASKIGGEPGNAGIGVRTVGCI